MWRKISQNLKTWKQKTQRLPLILYGARQIGKTYILLDLAKNNFPNYHYLNFEEDPKLASHFVSDLKPDRIINDLSLYLGKKINISEDLVIFDEIQTCPKALTSLKYFAEKMPELALASAGSLLGLELSPESFPVGKVEILHMHPMRFIEFLHGVEDQLSYEFLHNFDCEQTISEPIHDKLLKRLRQYFIVGGMPAVVRIFTENTTQNDFEVYEMVRDEQARIIQSVLADIAKHSGKENSMNISQTWQHMPSKLDSHYDANSSRFRFKGVLPNKERYKDFIGVLDWLEKANLVTRVSILDHIQIPLESSIKENIFKLYNYDVGILARLSNLRPQRILNHDYGSFKGYFVENFIAQELRSVINHFDPLMAWKEKDYELEFILGDQTGAPVPVEVKAGQTKTCTSLRKFIEKYKPKYKLIFSSDNFSKDTTNQVYRLPLYIPIENALSVFI